MKNDMTLFEADGKRYLTDVATAETQQLVLVNLNDIKKWLFNA